MTSSLESVKRDTFFFGRVSAAIDGGSDLFRSGAWLGAEAATSPGWVAGKEMSAVAPGIDGVGADSAVHAILLA